MAGLLTDAERDQLLDIACSAIARALTGQRRVLPPGPLTGSLAEDGCSFVTLTRDGRLRGCIGALEATEPLAVDVARHAVAAAMDDPRFPPLDTLAGIHVEISVLGPLRPYQVGSYEQLAEQVPQTGVLIAGLGGRATFLPAVWRQLPTRAEFLAALWRKAGLPAGAWPVSVWLYDVEEFGRNA